MSKSGNRIPFEEIENLKTWSLPALGDGHIVPSVKKQDQHNKQNENIEDLGQVPVSPMTAQQLEKITEEAEKEAKAQGFKEGKEEGEKQGLALGEQRAYEETKALLEEKVQSFQGMAEGLFDPLNMQDERIENWVINMAVQFTEHLIQRELTQDPSTLFTLVEKVVSALPVGAEHIRVYVNEADRALLMETFKESSWDFHADSKMSRGGCRVETDHSVADYSIETRIRCLLESAEFQEEKEDLPQPPDYQPELTQAVPDLNALELENEREDEDDAAP